MDRDDLKKFAPVLDSPLWGRLEDDYIYPELKSLQFSLESVTEPSEIYKLQGEIRCLRKLLSLRRSIKTAFKE